MRWVLKLRKLEVCIMSSRKQLSSSRNRHTGRINDIKQHILDNGTTQRSRDGTLYARIREEVTDKEGELLFINLSPIVKVPVL